MSRILEWLSDLGLSQYGDMFEQNDLDFDVLAALTETDLEEIGVSLGHRKRLLRAIATLTDTPSAIDADNSQANAQTSTGERLQATVLFSDLTGYTSMNETLDPEDVEHVMSRIKSEAVDIVERHGGIVNQFVGDEVMALFGVPLAHDDDPVRAVRAALEMHERVREISPEIELRIGMPIRLHTGINTGLIVTHMGDDRDGRFGVTGDTVNVGARLKSHADPDVILLSPGTQRLTANYFASEPQAPTHLKGKAETMVAHRVTGTITTANHFSTHDRSRVTPFTGRSQEMELLDNSLATALNGEGQVVTICAEPGIGKSRLLFEFRRHIDVNRVRIVHAGCPSSGRERSYSPFIDILYAALQLDDLDSSKRALEQVVTSVRAIDPDLEKYLPHYLDLLSISNDQYVLPPRFEGDEKRRAFEEALAGLFMLASRKRPLVMILEDWHWSDEASDSALAYLVGRIIEFPILIVVNHRPEYVPDWPDASHQLLLLEPLDGNDVETMMVNNLGANELPPGLPELITARADGNPLFIEEICNSLIEDGTVRVDGDVATLARPVEQIVLPSSVNAVIRGRLDRLGTDHKETLRLAAVIGREFDTRILERIHPHHTALHNSLGALVAQDVFRSDDRAPGRYSFKHILVQTVVYETLLLQQRRALHAEVGKAIEAIYADRLSIHFESLAYHFDLGECWDKATRYLFEAGVKALQHHVINVALRYFDRTRQILSEKSPETPWELRFGLSFHRATALGDRGQWPLALTELEDARNLAKAEGDDGRFVQAQVAQANAAFWAQNFNECLEIVAQLEVRMGAIPDIQLRISAQQAFLNFMVERLSTTLAKEQEAVELLRALPNSPNRSFAAFIVGCFLRWRGDHKEASKLLETAVRHDKDNESAGVYLQSLMHYCLAIGEQGNYQTAIDLLLEGREYGLAADSLYGVLKITNTLGWAFLEICNFSKATHYNKAALELIEEAKNANTSTLSEVASFTRLNLADIYLVTDQLDLAQEQLNLISTTLDHENFALARTRWKPRYFLAQGELSLALGDLDSAQEWLTQLDANVFTQKFPFNKHQARAGLLRGRVLHQQGMIDAALACVDAALVKAREVGNPTQIWKLLLALGDLMVSSDEDAVQHYEKAAVVVDGIASGLDDPVAARTFLDAAPIREVLVKARSL